MGAAGGEGRRRGDDLCVLWWGRHATLVSTRQADGAPVAVEEDAAVMAKLLLVSLVATSLASQRRRSGKSAK